MLKSMKKLGGGKRKPAETVVAYEKKKAPVAPMSISKAEAEDKVAGIKRMQEEQADITQGEKDFGSAYKSLGLKGTRSVQVNPTTGDATVKAKYKSTEGDEDVERIPNSEMVQVTKTGPSAGTDFSKFKETFKDRVERLAADKKARLKAKGMEILEAVKREKAKAESKARM